MGMLPPFRSKLLAAGTAQPVPRQLSPICGWREVFPCLRVAFGRCAAIQAVLRDPDVDDVELFFCGIDADNTASRRCASAAGSQLVDPEPDFEGTLYFRRGRPR
jgi:hypothetical protein